MGLPTRKSATDGRTLLIKDIHEDAVLALDVMPGAVKNRALWKGVQMSEVRRHTRELLVS